MEEWIESENNELKEILITRLDKAMGTILEIVHDMPKCYERQMAMIKFVKAGEFLEAVIKKKLK